MKLTDLIMDASGYLQEVSFLQEITFGNNAGEEIDWSWGRGEGFFKVGGTDYKIVYEYMDPSFIRNYNLNGTVLNIGFTRKDDDDSDIRAFIRKGGREDTIKVYATVFKGIKEVVKRENPNYLMISSFKKSGYHQIYNNLSKTNKIPGYTRYRILTDIPYHGIDGGYDAIIFKKVK